VIIGIPGGGWRQCNREKVPLFLVEHGFAIVCIQYRLSTEAIAPANIRDCHEVLNWARVHASEYGFDLNRIGVYGASAGGHLAALVAGSSRVKELNDYAEDSAHPVIKAVCAVCGPMDLTRMAIPQVQTKFSKLLEVTELYLGGSIAQKLEFARVMSPISYVSEDFSPTLLLHGSVDDIVPLEESIFFHEALKKVGANTRLEVLEGLGHGWLAKHTDKMIVSFFQNHLT
jgi:acetyl esterase/lipase